MSSVTKDLSELLASKEIGHQTAREVLALMVGDRLVMMVAKHPDGKSVTDITEQLARHLHHVRSAPPLKS